MKNQNLKRDNSLSIQQDKDKKKAAIPVNTDLNNLDVTTSDFLKKVLSTQEKLSKLISTEIKFSKPILEQSGNAVIFPNTIIVIQGQQGAHKSRLAENICSAFLKKHDCKSELLGFNRTNFDALHTVVYVDTERNLSDQLPFALQSILINAGFDKTKPPANFEYISLLQIPRLNRFATLNEYLNHIRQKSNSPLFIVLDVSTDCIEDFNKVDKSMELIDLMNMAINETDVTFLCIVHENPKSEKARGHFGTELMNKASTVMQVGFEKDDKQNDTELIRAKYLKCRSTAKHLPIYFKYSIDNKGLVLASRDEISTAANNRKQKAGIEDIIEHLELYLVDGTSICRNDLLKKLCIDFDTSSRTIEDRLNEIRKSDEYITNNNGHFCKLWKETKDKQIFYSLKQVENQ